MARIPYANITRPEDGPLVKRIAQERGCIPHLYAMLMHSSPVAEGWLGYLTAIRQKCILPAPLRELMIVQVARLNEAQYEADQHEPLALREGISQAQIDALPNWQASDLFDEKEQAALAYCDAMTRKIDVPKAVFAEASRLFEARILVELTATIAAYNMVSRFIGAMDIQSRDELNQ